VLAPKAVIATEAVVVEAALLLILLAMGPLVIHKMAVDTFFHHQYRTLIFMALTGAIAVAA
jgi:hypothetical protein